MPLVVAADSLFAMGGLGPVRSDARRNLGVHLAEDRRTEGSGPATGAWSQAAPIPNAFDPVAAAGIGGLLEPVGGGPFAGFSQSDVMEFFAPGQEPGLSRSRRAGPGLPNLARRAASNARSLGYSGARSRPRRTASSASWSRFAAP
jgi:hypothetical protein